MYKIQKLTENDKYFLTAPTKVKYFNSCDYIKESPLTINNNNQSLPRIKEKNNTKFFDNGGEEGERGECEDGGIHGNDESKMLSSVFVEDRVNKRIYRLEFKATNVKLIPIYLKTREFKLSANDKSNQPKGKTIYENIYNKRAKRFSQLAKSFKLDLSGDERLSKMSFKKPLLQTRQTYPQDPKPKPSISDTSSNIKRSVMYINYKGVLFHIKPKLMTLKSSVMIDFEAQQKREKLLRRLNMELPADLKNKAQIIVNYKGDILKFVFILSDLNCNKLKVTSSIGIMVKDDHVYKKDFSNISCKKIYIAIPKSNYEYRDPMINKKQRNLTMKLNKIDPLWLVEQRKKRINEYNQCRNKNPYDDIMELNIGSSICFESFNCINKIKAGTLSCSVSDEEYEKWVQAIQRSDFPLVIDNFNEQTDSTFNKDVPDWDLVVNLK